MKNMWNSVLAGGCHVLGLSLLVLSATVGGSTVRAANPSILQNAAFDPIAQIVLRVEQRVADLEATVAAFAESFTSDRVVVQELCVADSSGAQTCITKAQLEALLRGAMQMGQASATIESGAAQTSADKSVLANASVAVPIATESTTATADEAGTNPAAVMPSAIHKPASAEDEHTMPVLADTTVMSSTTLPPTARGPVAAGEPRTPRAAVTKAMPPTIEPAEAVNATEQPVKNEGPGYSDAEAVKSPVLEPNLIPAETPQRSECQE